MASSSSSSPEISAASAATGSSQSTIQYAHLTREEVLEELSSRFILNLPGEELASVERVCFQVEQAHWYYEDFIREQAPSKFPSYTLKTFSEVLFRVCPPLQHWAHDHERAYESFMKYKTRVPVCGAIMLNDTWEKCVLVKGWKSSAGWGFPKGKINEQEPRTRCAAREVLEETGYDLEGQIVPEDVIELSIKEQSISLYIVPGVPEDYPFKTRTRKEISKIAWFRLSDLPTWKRSKSVPGKFYLISPFIGPLKAFINSRKPRNLQRRPRRSDSMQIYQELHQSSEEDSMPIESCQAASSDLHAQESSSQSSSADNGEPQTPSPQYSAPLVHYEVKQPVIQAASDAGDSLDLTGVDPHFARLLSSLTLSASTTSVPADRLSIDQSQLPSSFTSKDAAPRPMAAAESSGRSYATKESSVATGFTNGYSSSVTPSTTVSPRSQSRPPTATPMRSSVQRLSNSSPQPRIGTSSSAGDYTVGTISSAVVSSSPRSGAADMTSSKQSPKLARPRHGSKVSADISPYLSRPRDISKEMKYISMLENVAKESDKISHQRIHASPSYQSMLVYPIEPPSGMPGPSISVPPVSLYGRLDSSLIYTSGPTTLETFASGVPPVPRQIPLHGAPIYDDPFTVRPRTSAAFHPLVYPPSFRQPLDESIRRTTPGIEHGQMPRPLMSGNYLPPGSVPHYTQPSSALHAQPMAGAPGVTPLRVVPPPFPAAVYGEQPPLSAPAISPSSTFAFPPNAPRPANNAHLLSILNTPSTAHRTVPVQAGLMNGMGPR